MSLDFLPDYKTIVNRSRSDIKKLLPDLDPTIFASFIKAIVESNAGRHYDNVLSISQLVKELFPDTAELQNLLRWAAYEGITPFPALQAQGKIIVTGSAGAIVLETQRFQTSDLKTYTADADSTLSLRTIAITSLTRSGTTVTATTATDHPYASNITVTMSGAVQTDYNGDFAITVTAANKFTYEITETPTTPATGTILSSCTCATVNITSAEFGEDQNLDSGAELTIAGGILGIDNEAYVNFSGITNGQDTETKENLLARTIQSRSKPVANFNSAAIEKEALKIRGVTRVKVKRVTPDIGDVTILFVRDNDDNIIPSAAERTAVKNQILTILPATSEEDDVYVPAMTGVDTDYVFSSITPSTESMKTAIENNIIAMYEDDVDFETDIVEDKYRSAIINTVDPENGDKLTAFTLSSPSGDITVTTNEIGIPGNITF